MAAYEYVLDSGVIVSDSSLTKAEVQEEYTEIFGDDLDLSDESPEGVLINFETIARNGVAANNALLANQINPNIAGGKFLDAIWSLSSALTGGRFDATKSFFSQQVDVTGIPGTIIPSGSVAETSTGDQFETLSNVTIGAAGDAVVSFQSVETGPIAAAAGALNTISQGQVLGWETVSNPVPATLGSDEESDGSSRVRRRETLAIQGQGTPEAVKSRLSDIQGVRSFSFRENVTNATEIIDNVLLVGHSIYVCVDGGTDEEVADNLLYSKGDGCAWNGMVNVPVTYIYNDGTIGQIYDVKFDRPEEVQIWIRVTIAETTVSNPSDIVVNAILDYINGDIDGEKGFVVGGSVSPFEISGAVNIANSSIFVRNVELSLDGITYISSEIQIEISQVPRSTSSQIQVVVS